MNNIKLITPKGEEIGQLNIKVGEIGEDGVYKALEWSLRVKTYTLESVNL